MRLSGGGRVNINDAHDERESKKWEREGIV